MPHVFDYSTGRPSHATLVSVGALGVCRYLSQRGVDPSRWAFNEAKRIRLPEYESLEAHGIPITLNCQVDKADWQGGYPRGVEHGRMALAQCRELGHPLSRPVIFTVQDSGIPSSSLHLAVEYMHGCMDGNERGPQPLYGGTTVINACVEAGYASWGWLPEDATSWSPRPSPYVRLVQHGSKSYPQLGVPYDENTPLHPDWGQHPAPGIVPPPQEEPQDMAFVTTAPAGASTAPAGAALLVAADCSWKMYLNGGDITTLMDIGYKFSKPLTANVFDSIPFRTDVQAKQDTIISLLMHIDQGIDFALTPEQIEEIATAIGEAVPPITAAEVEIIADATVDELVQRAAN